MYSKKILNLILILLAAASVIPSFTAPAFALSPQGLVRDWEVLGPFPNPVPENAAPGMDRRLGFDQDWLQSLGGEGKAQITPDSKASHESPDGRTVVVSATTTTVNPSDQVNFKSLFPKGHQVAYAFAWIESASNQTATFYFGSNDGAKVWVDGKLVHEFYASDGRPVEKGTDVFTADLKTGRNGVLVKVEDGGGATWGFVLEVYDESGVAKREKERALAQGIKSFQATIVEPEGLGFIFPLGPLPPAIWRDPFSIEGFVLDPTLETTWYDSKLNPVTEAAEPGPYIAYVEGQLYDGSLLRRGMLVYAVPAGWKPPLKEIELYVDKIPAPETYKKRYRDTLFELESVDEIPINGFGIENDAALVYAFESTRDDPDDISHLETPEILHDDLVLKVKLHVLGIEFEKSPLNRPMMEPQDPAPTLKPGSLADAGFKDSFPSVLKPICEGWAKEGGEPFTVLIARHGVIAFHESFGEIPPNEPLWWASVSKTIAGALFAEFVDEGLIDIDDPVGKHVAGFPTEGPQMLTFRHCFTHTSGLDGHAQWGGLRNAWVENVIANGAPWFLPGKVHRYNGTGYNLAGKAMELKSGISIGRLMRERLLDPLGMTHTNMDDLGYETYSTSMDIGRLAQMILNRGKYGPTRFFSEKTFERLLPEPLAKYCPGLDQVWGIGLIWLDEGPNPSILGHGAASGAHLRIDLGRDMVVAVSRDQPGEKFNDYMPKFLQAIEEGLIP